MAIKNVEMGNSLSHISTRVRAIGRQIAEHPGDVFRTSKRMVGRDVAPLGVYTQNIENQGVNVGFAGSRVGPNPISVSETGFNKGHIQDAASYYIQRRYGRMDSNLGFNRIPGLQRGPRF